MDGHLTIGSAGALPARDGLRALPRRSLHAGRNWTKAAIDLVDLGSRRFVLKDVASCPWPVRRLLGPWQLRREARAYRRLEGLAGIPRLLGVIDAQAIALEFVEGPPLRSLRRGDLDDAFFDRLDRLLRLMHDRGVAHGDLHHGDVLAGPRGQPYIVDFATCAIAGAPGGLRRLLYDQLRRADQRAAAKLRRRLAPAGGHLPPSPGLYRVGAALRRLIRRFSSRS